MRCRLPAAAALVLLVGGCQKSAPDAVPPAPSGGLAPAPPGALGARAAGLDAGGAASDPLDPGQALPPHGAGGSPPASPTLAPPAGSGVAL